MKKTIILAFILLVHTNTFAQTKNNYPLSIYNKNVLQGQGGIKFSTGTRFNKQSFVELGYFRTDMPSENDSTAEDKFLPLGNQNIYGAVAFSKINNDIYLAPKIGYEYSLLLFSARVSWVNYFNLTNKARDARILLEPGFSIFGYASIYYGFSYHIGGMQNDKIGKHNITFTLNYFDAFRPKYKKL